MKEAGLENVEKIPFPADGKTGYQDKISPLAWDATCGRLTITKSPVAQTRLLPKEVKPAGLLI